MGITISKPPINLREQLTELKAQQGYEEQQFHFDNLVTNGTFDTDTSGWTALNSATLTNPAGNLDVENSAALAGYAYQAVTTKIGGVYKYSVDLTHSGDDGFIRVGTGSTVWTIYSSASLTTTGSYSTVFTATTTTTYIRVGNYDATSGHSTAWDNISVYEIDPADNKVIHTMPKGWKPLHVFEDGALQREGSAYDYTVEYDGFNYIVKETVAPVAPYSTTVIGVRA